MAIFPVIETESVVQVGDLTRIVGERSTCSPDVEIGYMTVYINDAQGVQGALGQFEIFAVDGKYCDFQFSGPGEFEVILSVETTTNIIATTSKVITVVSEATDALLSSDDDLKVHESEILNLLRAGRATFNDVHRRAKKMIIDSISLENVRNGTGNEITVSDIHNTEALKDWSTYLALRLIFLDNSASAEDRFERRSNYYKSYEDQAKAIAFASVKFDENSDDVADTDEPMNFGSISLVRR